MQFTWLFNCLYYTYWLNSQRLTSQIHSVNPLSPVKIKGNGETWPHHSSVALIHSTHWHIDHLTTYVAQWFYLDVEVQRWHWLKRSGGCRKGEVEGTRRPRWLQPPSQDDMSILYLLRMVRTLQKPDFSLSLFIFIRSVTKGSDMGRGESNPSEKDVL